MKAHVYTITAQTNLHPGSGDANYGIIDKLVQRDPVSGYPVIHASSLKGSILQHFFHQPGMSDEYIDTVFGGQTHHSKRISKQKRAESKRGEFIFMQAQLLSIPMRVDGINAPFVRVSSPSLLLDFRSQLLQFDAQKSDSPICTQLESFANAAAGSAVSLDPVNSNIRLEDLPPFQPTHYTEAPLVKHLLGGDTVIILPEAQMQQLTDNHHLPVIARNHLENGQSTNLWYEQILPRQTIFVFFVLDPEQYIVEKSTAASSEDAGENAGKNKKYDGTFEQILTQKGLIQIGANASVGYGFCDIKPAKLA